MLGDAAGPAADYKGNAAEANWLPNAAFAKAWTEYVKTGATSDTTPPEAPFSVATKTTATGVEVTWDAHADLESGLRQFIVLRDGQPVARVPEKPANSFGRPLFQNMSYGDTPGLPLAQMRYVDKTGQAANRYQVVAINSVGLESSPSK